MAEKKFRNKITWFSFIFSLLVVWIHSYNTELYAGQSGVFEPVYRMEHWIGDGLGQIAVPGFFMISGYLFYRDFTWEKLGEKWQRRIRSVLAPYILWNLLYYLGYAAGSRLPWISGIVGKGLIPLDLNTAVSAVLYYTFNYVFWYLFQLILLILLAPLLYPVLKHPVSRAAFLAFLWWVVARDLRLPYVNGDALIYYSTAASLALSKRSWVEADPSGGIPLGAAAVCAAVVCYQTGLRLALIPCFVLCRLLAVMGLWLLIPAGKLNEAGDFMKMNFFFYAVHFPIVRFINKAGAKLLPPAPAAPLCLYLAMPALALLISVTVGKCLRRRAPLLWSLLNGGRGGS